MTPTGVEGAFEAFKTLAERHRAQHAERAKMTCRLSVADDGNAAIEARLELSGRIGSCYHVLRGDLAGELEDAMAKFECLCLGITDGNQ